MKKLQPVRGTHDILPEDNRRIRYVMDAARRMFDTYGYGEITPPMFEFTEVFQRTLGDTSDVVTKETYSFTDRGGESLTLRPEFTASIARAFISGGLQEKLPLKFFYHGSAFRYERPQKGRQRQFNQLGVEFLGVASPAADVEVITLANDVLMALGLKGKVKLQLNSLGDTESRQNYRTALVDYYQSHKTGLSEDSLKRLERNPLRILDSKDEGDRKINAGAPRIESHFTQEAHDFFGFVQEGLETVGISYNLNPKLVRGLDYYNHTVFEFTSELIGAQDTVLAGGRYDSLIATMGGSDTPGIGWAAGMERLIDVIDFSTVQESITPKRPLAMIALGGVCEKQALKIAHDLRMQGFYTESYHNGNLAKRMKKANAHRAVAALILGEDELKSGQITVRHLDSGEQETVAIDSLGNALKHYNT